MKRLKKLIYALPVMIALVFIVPPIHANATDWSTYTVHVTKTGSKYHMAGCSYLKSDIPINIIDAVNSGYTPCSRCNPPYPTVTNTNAYQSTLSQDTVYRGYYTEYAIEYNRRKLSGEFDNNIWTTAYNASSYEYLTEDERNIYIQLSDADRDDFFKYKLLTIYDEAVSFLANNYCIFDYVYYATSYPEKWQFCGYDPLCLWAYFMMYDAPQGIQGSPTFNVYNYINNNPDLIATFGSDLSAYYTHYRDYGQYEGRKVY